MSDPEVQYWTGRSVIKEDNFNFSSKKFNCDCVVCEV